MESFLGALSEFCLCFRIFILDFLSNSHEKYGSVVKLWLGPTQLLVSMKDPYLIREMLLKAADKLPMTGRAFHLAFGRSSLFASSFHKVSIKFSSFFYFIFSYYLFLCYVACNAEKLR